jgi:predicted Zn-dependent protease
MRSTGCLSRIVRQWVIRERLSSPGIHCYSMNCAWLKSGLRPSLPDGWYELATVQTLAGNLTTALANFVRTCELQSADPKNQSARCRCLGKLFVRQNQSDKAIEQFRQAIEIRTGNREAHFEWAAGYLNQLTTDHF